MAILQMSLSLPTPPQHLSFSRSLSSPTPLFLHSQLSRLSLTPKMTPIRMGGGPRTYPGGVSKWQWKRMQAKKAKQLLKARLLRERQIYEMRKRAELKAAIAELERPWEPVQKPPNLFSVSADEQLKVLADRFQKPGGFDLWTDRDGPQLFKTKDDLPSARFFPKGVVHSVKPYKRISGLDGGEEALVSDDENGMASQRSIRRPIDEKFGEDSDSSDVEASFLKRNPMETKAVKGRAGDANNNSSSRKWMKNRNRRTSRSEFASGSGDMASGQVGFDRRQSGGRNVSRGTGRQFSRSDASEKLKYMENEVYDMSLQGDGSYRYRANIGEANSNSKVIRAGDIQSI